MKYKLIVFNMDGVIFTHKNFWRRMHIAYGTEKWADKYEEKYLKEDYKKLVDLVIRGLWLGKDAKTYYDLVNSAEYNPCVKKTFKELKKLGIKKCLMTSGPDAAANRVKKELGFDYVFSNVLGIKDEKISGEFHPSYDFHGKGNFLKEFCKKEGFDLKEVITVGDGDNDVSKAKISGLSIAFNSHSDELKKVCDVIIDSNDLRKILRFVK